MHRDRHVSQLLGRARTTIHLTLFTQANCWFAWYLVQGRRGDSRLVLALGTEEPRTQAQRDNDHQPDDDAPAIRPQRVSQSPSPKVETSWPCHLRWIEGGWK